MPQLLDIVKAFNNQNIPPLLPRKLRHFQKPLGLVIQMALVKRFGSFAMKQHFDLVSRPQYAYGMLRAAILAKKQGKRSTTVCEFGVWKGDGLAKMVKIAEEITQEYGIHFNIVGFESGEGLAPALGHRDHPEIWSPGVFTTNIQTLEQRFQSKACLKIGKIEDTVDGFLSEVTHEAPIGFIAIDVDRYEATISTLRSLKGVAEQYLPTVSVYLDDIAQYESNKWCGELAAVNEFNATNEMRKIDEDRTLYDRPIPNAKWHKKMFAIHFFDHPSRQGATSQPKLQRKETLVHQDA